MKKYIPILLLMALSPFTSCNSKNEPDTGEDKTTEVRIHSIAGVWKTAFRERMEFTPNGDVYICEINEQGEEKIKFKGRYRDNGSVVSIKLDLPNSVDVEPGVWEKHHYRIHDHPVVTKVLEFYDPKRPNRATSNSEFVRGSSR